MSMAKKKAADITPRRELGKPLTDEQKRGLLHLLVKDAEDYIDSYIAPARERATDYFNGEPFGNEERGRSQVVMTEVRDVVLAMMPSLMRVFLSSEKVVEYLPRRMDAVEMAEQATDYINYIFFVENDGEGILYALLEDALVRKTGIATWYPNEEKCVTEEEYSGITEDQIAVLSQEEGMELLEDYTEVLTDENEQPILSPEGQPLYNVKFRRTVVDRKFVVEAVPPEEFIISRDARCEDTARLIGRRCKKLVSDLVAEGYDLETILQHGKLEPIIEMNMEAAARNPALEARGNIDYTRVDPSILEVQYYDVLVLMDADGDGIAERHRICALGGSDSLYVLSDEVVSGVNYAIFCPAPVPHSAIGNSIADQVMDLQLIKSNIVRSTLDSLAQSIFPRTAVVEHQVNMSDVLNNEIGGIIRMRQPGMVQPLDTPFVGQQALPLLAYLDDTRAQRTGISRTTQGLDADVLQSTTKDAVTAVVTAAESRLEMVARLLAGGGLKRLFRGLLRLVVEHQDRKRVVKLRGKWVEVDPASWDVDMHVVTNVGVGLGNKQERIAFLMQVAQQQKEILMTLGPVNPLCDLTQFRETLGRVVELNGYKDTESFFKRITAEDMQQFMQQMAQNKKPSVEEIYAQIEQMKVTADIEKERANLALKEREMRLRDDRERDKIESDAFLKAFEIEAKYQTTVDVERLRHLMERQRMAVETALTLAEAETNAQEEQVPVQGPTPDQMQGMQ